jgi:hypothetical protein
MRGPAAFGSVLVRLLHGCCTCGALDRGTADGPSSVPEGPKTSALLPPGGPKTANSPSSCSSGSRRQPPPFRSPRGVPGICTGHSQITANLLSNRVSDRGACGWTPGRAPPAALLALRLTRTLLFVRRPPSSQRHLLHQRLNPSLFDRLTRSS